MADEGFDIPVNLDIDDAERELLKLQKKISRTKISLDVAIGNKEELKQALAENEAAAAAIRAKRDNGTFTGADVRALEELSLQWTQIRKQIVAADAAERGYRATISATSAEYATLAQAIENRETEAAVSALRDKFHALGEELVKPIQRIKVNTCTTSPPQSILLIVSAAALANPITASPAACASSGISRFSKNPAKVSSGILNFAHKSCPSAVHPTDEIALLNIVARFVPKFMKSKL